MVQIIYDDTIAVPEEIKAFVGISHFSSIVYRHKSLLDTMRGLAEALSWPAPIHLSTEADIAELADQIRIEDDNELYLVALSNLVPRCREDEVLLFLQQIQYSPAPLYMFLQDTRGRRGWTLMRAPLLKAYLRKQLENDVDAFFADQGDRIVHVHDRLPLIDLRDEPVLQEFLSGQFDARHFNSVERDRYTVIKRSQNREKLKEEFDFYYLVPPVMQTFLVQPFDFQDDGKWASYRMERVGAPDMATQWINGAIQPHELERFLSHLFYFIDIRPRRQASRSESAAVHKFLYEDKVKSRIAALMAHPAYPQLAPLLQSACGGIDRVVEGYFQLLEETRRHAQFDDLVVGHGDPCFSNIFYSKASQYLKLIDPRGAKSEEALFTHPLYDVAKISHSVQGGYDFINNGKFDITVDGALRARLKIESPSLGWAAEMFQRQLEKSGFDPRLIRLYEASLFISMLPLHIDRPRKVLAFAINAADILASLSIKDVTA